MRLLAVQRTFIVGCPRSGTTFMQALLARHPDVYTLPETAFFEHLHADLEWRWGDHHARPRPRRWRQQRLGLMRKQTRLSIAPLLHSLSGERAPIRRIPFSSNACATTFIDLLDALALRADCSLWVEKTPNHLLYLPEIEACAPGARFIHVIRRGTDVLASLADAYLRFENDDAFGGGSVHWARRWNRAMQIHEACLGRAHHAFVFLEDLVREPDDEWVRICQFLGLRPDIRLADACSQTIADLEHEPWKRDAISGLPQPMENKADDLFTTKFQLWLNDHLASYDNLRAKYLLSRSGAANVNSYRNSGKRMASVSGNS
ncbi:MAG TPA: sulfotransferase [Rhodanobacter sp.]|nr:sulfotransferase [Rhodanobacter sp.]